jgi:hypothetical protein
MVMPLKVMSSPKAKCTIVGIGETAVEKLQMSLIADLDKNVYIGISRKRNRSLRYQRSSA